MLEHQTDGQGMWYIGRAQDEGHTQRSEHCRSLQSLVRISGDRCFEEYRVQLPWFKISARCESFKFHGCISGFLESDHGK